MSFKREGDDGAWLRSLQKRRVSELLSEDISPGEAHLMKNGKFACMVCSHRPVFDTVDVLRVHRGGKKHLVSVESKQVEDDELNQLKLARAHQQYTDTGEIPPELNSHEELQSQGTNSERLLGSKSYDARTKHKPHRRRQVLDLSEASSGSIEHVDSSQTISEFRKRKRLREMSVQGASIQQVRPYLCKTRRTDHLQPQGYDKNSLTNQCVEPPLAGGVKFRHDMLPTRTTSGSQTTPVGAIHEHAHDKLDKPRQSGFGVKSTHSSKCSNIPTLVGPPGVSCKEKAEQRGKYLQAIASGWKKNKSGDWVKDDNAEFDSDDEPPNLP